MFAEMLYVHRRRRAMSQEVLAMRTGLSARSIRNLEAGSVRMPRPDTVRRLADGLALAGADRDRFQSAATAMYLDSREPDDKPPVQLVVTEGTITVGGNTFTLHWTGKPADGAAERELRVNLRGYTTSVDSRGPTALLHDLLDAFGFAASAPDHPDRRMATRADGSAELT